MGDNFLESVKLSAANDRFPLSLSAVQLMLHRVSGAASGWERSSAASGTKVRSGPDAALSRAARRQVCKADFLRTADARTFGRTAEAHDRRAGKLASGAEH